MYKNRMPVVAAIALLTLLSACSGSRYASQNEYDDAYFTSSDRAAERRAAREAEAQEAQTPSQPSYSEPQTSYSDLYAAQRREPVENYSDYYYEDDDFTFSRRVRRFNQSNYGSWRYFDPFYANDLYFVIGTPVWNSWNSWGWYNWNAPRFGSVWAADFYNPWNPWNQGWGWNAFYANSWSPFAFDPWVGSYYGYGFPGGFYGNPWGGWNGGWGGGFNSPYYCPPNGFVPFNAWNRQQETYVTRVRNSTQSGASQTNYNAPRAGLGNAPAGNLPAPAASQDYLSPRARVVARPGDLPTPGNSSVLPGSQPSRAETPQRPLPSANMPAPDRDAPARSQVVTPAPRSNSPAPGSTARPQVVNPRSNTPAPTQRPEQIQRPAPRTESYERPSSSPSYRPSAPQPRYDAPASRPSTPSGGVRPPSSSGGSSLPRRP